MPAIRMKPTAYGPVFVRTGEGGVLRYGTRAKAIDGETPLAGSPAEILLSAIGACMVLSIGIVAARDGVELGPFHVEVRATKSEQPPSHFGRYRIRVSGGLVPDPQDAEVLVQRAKTVCTISNSLNGAIELLVGP